MKKFRADQWWSRKCDAYTTILDALHDKINFNAMLGEERTNNDTYSPQALQKATTADQQATLQLQKSYVISNFLLSKQAVEALSKLFRTIIANQDQPDDSDQTNARTNALRTCIQDLPDIARRDLQV